MTSPNFIDEVNLYVQAGRGAPGAVHFRREKFVPKGGPDGGDGGRGGHIILRGNQQLATLLHLKYRKHVAAANGQPGQGACKTGADGHDIVLEVPLGTVAKQAESEQVLLEITQDGQQALLMEGGSGGYGNTHFKSATQQAPRYAQPGKPGAAGWIRLELKLLADVGLVGLPNAGKSTLISTLSAARPKIASYPFTTLVPNLGVVSYQPGQTFVMADIPGIVSGAARGKGLGIRFLRHIERNVILLFIIASNTPDISQAYATLVEELKYHDPALLDKAKLIVISKADLIDKRIQERIIRELPRDIGHVFISSITGQGLNLLIKKIWGMLHPRL